MREIFVVTHPESAHHVEDRVGGWYDSALTERGHTHARLIARALAPQLSSAARVYSSDLRRCLETASYIAEAIGVDPQPNHGLREKSYGEGEGRPDTWFRERFIPPPNDGDRMHHFEGLQGSETKAEWTARVYNIMDEILADDADQIVIVTHGGTATFVISHWIGMAPDSLERVRFAVASGSITHLKRDDYFHNHSVESLGSVTHLDGDMY